MNPVDYFAASCRPNPVGTLTSQQEQVHAALMRAADQIGKTNAASYQSAIKRDRKGRITQTYRITEEHARVIQMAEDVARGRITPEEGMAVLHEYGVMQARFRKNPASGRDAWLAQATQEGKRAGQKRLGYDVKAMTSTQYAQHARQAGLGPDAVRYLVRTFIEASDQEFLFGEPAWMKKQGLTVEDYPAVLYGRR